MSNNDHSYDLTNVDLHRDITEIFDQQVYMQYRLGAEEFKIVAIAPPPESFVFTKEQLINILRLCYSSGVETELERQLRTALQSHIPPEVPDQS